MRISALCLMILLGMAVLVSGVSASGSEKTGNYTVVSAGNLHLPSVTSLASSVITQGQVDVYSRVISSGTSSIITDLYWGNPANSLSLTIVAPDETLGPYYDSADGIINGRIALSVSSSAGLTPGTWKFYITGYSVTGSQAYTFLTY